MIIGGNKQVVTDRTATITHDFVVGHEYEVIVRAVGPDGTAQPIENSARNTIVIAGKVENPLAPSGLTATGFINSISLSWTNSTDHDFDVMEVWRSATNDIGTAVKAAETRSTHYVDAIGTANITRYYWIRARNTSNKTSFWWPLTNEGVEATTLGVAATDIDDFAITATKMFTNTIVLTADSWTDNSPTAGKIAWNGHTVVYNGASYAITAGNTALAYVYWTIGAATYSASATHPVLGTVAFMIAINTAGVHTLVWNSSANMVIGTAFIADLAVTEAKIASASITNAKIGSLAVQEGNIANLAVTEAKIANATITTAKIASIASTFITVTGGQNWAAEAGADVTGSHTAADTAKVQGSTIIVGGYIATSFLTADNIQAGTLTGRTIRSAASGQRLEFDSTSNALVFYRAAGTEAGRIDEDVANSIYISFGDGVQSLWASPLYISLITATEAVPLISGKYLGDLDMQVFAAIDKNGVTQSMITANGNITGESLRLHGTSGSSLFSRNSVGDAYYALNFNAASFEFLASNVSKATIDASGNMNIVGNYSRGGTQVVGARVVDARADDAVSSTWSATEAGVLDALRDAMIAHGLIAAS